MSKVTSIAEQVERHQQDIDFYLNVVARLKETIEHLQADCEHYWGANITTHGGELRKCVKCGKIDMIYE